MSGASVRAILHPTDFTVGSEVAFVHALKIATSGGGRFTIIHAEPAGGASAGSPDFPHVRETLERWGSLPPASDHEDVFNQLGVLVNKVTASGSSIVNAINEHIVSHPVDLLVLATRGREDLPQWIRPSVSERLARLSKTTTLFVPTGARGFVSSEDGTAHLRRILVPVAGDPLPHAAVTAACALAQTVAEEPVLFDLLHVGTEDTWPMVQVPMHDRRHTFRRVLRVGHVVDEIMAAAATLESDLIAMSTLGHHGFLDALRGSTAEQVLHRSSCPVLVASVATASDRIPWLEFGMLETGQASA